MGKIPAFNKVISETRQQELPARRRRRVEPEDEASLDQLVATDQLSVGQTLQGEVPLEAQQENIQLAQIGLEAAGTVIDAAASLASSAPAAASATASAASFGAAAPVSSALSAGSVAASAAGAGASAAGAAAAAASGTGAVAATSATVASTAVGGASSLAAGAGGGGAVGTGAAAGAAAAGAAAAAGGGSSPSTPPPVNGGGSGGGSSGGGNTGNDGGGSGSGLRLTVNDDFGPLKGNLASGSSTDDRTPTFSFTAESGRTIRVYDGDTLLGVAIEGPAGSYVFTPSRSLSIGQTYNIRASITDANGIEGARSEPAFVFTIDTTPPVRPAPPVDFKDDVSPLVSDSSRAPTTDDTTPGIKVGPGLNGSPNFLTPRLYVNGVQTPAIYDPVSGTLTPVSPLRDGDYTFTYSVTDPAGNESLRSDPLRLRIDTEAPLAPTVNLVDSNTSAPTISGTATLLPGESLEVTVNGATYQVTPDSNGFWSLDFSVNPAPTPVRGIPGVFVDSQSYEVEAIAIDAAGNRASDKSSSELRIDSALPNAPSVTALLTEDSTPLIEGRVLLALGETLTVTVNGQSYSFDPANPSATPWFALDEVQGTWSLDLGAAAGDPLGYGSYTVTATVTNSENKQASASGPLVIGTPGFQTGQIILVGQDTTPGPYGPFDGPVPRDTLSFAANSPDPAWNLNTPTPAINSALNSPGNPLGKSLVIDLGGAADPNQFRTFFYTQNSSLDQASEYTTIGSYKNIINVIGTDKSDTISGDSKSNTIVAGAGADIVYGGGGSDTLNGGSGIDWVLFSPLTRQGETNNPYTQNLIVNLGTGNYSFGTAGAAGTVTNFENALGSPGADSITGSTDANIIVGGHGADTIFADSGDDKIYGGSHLLESGGGSRAGNQIWGGNGKDEFFVGFDYNPLNSQETELTSIDVIRDWELASDKMRISSTAVAVIGGLWAQPWTNWSGDDTVDVSGTDVVNNGQIRIAAGAGENQIMLSRGRDILYVGYEYLSSANVIAGNLPPSELINPATDTPGLGAKARDVLWHWDDKSQASTRDSLFVSANDSVVIGSLRFGPDNSAEFTNWDGDDIVDLRQDVANAGIIKIGMGAGRNTVYGSSGADEIYGFSGADDHANTVWGRDGSDTFFVGYNFGIDPDSGLFSPPATDSTRTEVISVDLIQDWDGFAGNTGLPGQDSLWVSPTGRAVLAGLAGKTHWNASDLVDLSSETFVKNTGTVVVSAGAGYDQIIGSTGDDELSGGVDAGYDLRIGGKPGNSVIGGNGSDDFYVGYDFVTNIEEQGGGAWGESSTLGSEVSGTDVIYDWDDQDNGTSAFGGFGRDSLYVSAKGTAVIAGLAANVDGSNWVDWSGNDLVDLRGGNGTTVDNKGKIVVITGAGNDTIYGSNGNDWVYAGTPGSGYDDINLGSSVGGDGADRVYITDWNGKYWVKGFDSEDYLFIKQEMLDSFFTASFMGYKSRYLGPLGAASTGFDGSAVVSGSAVNLITGNAVTAGNTLYAEDMRGAARNSGQGYDESFRFPTSKLVWDAAYSDSLGDYTSLDTYTRDVLGLFSVAPWYSNGAWSNDAHRIADIGGTSAVSALAYGYLAAANALVGIPFVGPIIAIPFYVIAGLTIADAVTNTNEQRNATYSFGSSIDQYVTLMAGSGANPASPASWDLPFLEFFNIPASRFTPTLEVTSQPLNTGIGTVVTLFNGTETFVYLVFSIDSMIQNNETRLIARVNGQVSASQIVVYDAASDPHFNEAPEAVVFAPEITSVILAANDTDTMASGLSTSDSTPELTVNFSKSLIAGDEVVVKYAGEVVTPKAAPIPGVSTSLVYSLEPGKVDGAYLLEITVTNKQGFSSSVKETIFIDATAILESDMQVSANSAGIQVSFKAQNGTDSNGDPIYVTAENATVELRSDLTQSGLIASKLLDLDNGFSNLVPAQAQTGVTNAGLYVVDSLGRRTELKSINAVLGTDGSDAVLEGDAGKVNLIYGFKGNDSMSTLGSIGDYLFGGEGDDTLTGGLGTDYLDGGAGADTLAGGADDDVLIGGLGEDTLTGGEGSDVFAWGGPEEFDEGDSVMDFQSGFDKIQIAGVASHFSQALPSFTTNVSEGDTNNPEIQRISFNPGTQLVDGAAYSLTVGGVTLSTSRFSTKASSAEEISNQLQGDSDYLAAPFTLSVDGNDLVITWKDKGNVADIASLSGSTIDFSSGDFVVGGGPNAASAQLLYRSADDPVSGEKIGELFFDADGTGAEEAKLIATLFGGTATEAPSLLWSDILLV